MKQVPLGTPVELSVFTTCLYPWEELLWYCSGAGSGNGGLLILESLQGFKTLNYESPLDCKWSNESILKEISPEYSLEGLMLKLKLQYFGHLMQRTDSLENTLVLGKTEGGRRRGTTEDEVVGWHHWLNGHEFEQVPGVGDGQGSLACCSPWGPYWATELNYEWGVGRSISFWYSCYWVQAHSACHTICQ